MIDSWNSFELISLSSESKLWKTHLLTLLLILLLGFNHSQFRFHHFVSKPVQKNMQFRFFLVFFRIFHFFQFQVVSHLPRKTFSWIFVFRHFKHFQGCRFFKNNLEPKFFQFRNSKFQNNFKFRSFSFRSENPEEVFNKQFNSPMFRFLSCSISIAHAQLFPWAPTLNENKMSQQHDRKQIENYHTFRFY